MEHADLELLQTGLQEIARSPKDEGRLELIVRRPAVAERETLDAATLDEVEGLVGDGWLARGTASRNGSPNPKAQLTLMNIRVAKLVARTPDRVPLAGDQLFVDLDITAANAPPGTRLSIGSAVVEVSDDPHLGCRKFLDRFGRDAHRFVSARENRALNLRGVNAMVVTGGTVAVGDVVRKTS